MDLEQIGYFLYMEEQERQQKVNVKYNFDLVGEEATTNEEEEEEDYFS